MGIMGWIMTASILFLHCCFDGYMRGASGLPTYLPRYVHLWESNLALMLMMRLYAYDVHLRLWESGFAISVHA